MHGVLLDRTGWMLRRLDSAAPHDIGLVRVLTLDTMSICQTNFGGLV